MKIKSRTDVITNSSTEVFCYKLSDPVLERFKKAVPWLSWDEFKTEEDVKALVMDPDYCGIPWDSHTQCHHGPEVATPSCDIMAQYDFKEAIKGTKTDEEVWNFIKDFYSSLIGKAVATIENDCISDGQYRKIEDFLGEIYKEKLEKHLGQFRVGDILEVDLINGLGTVLIKKVSDTAYEALPESWEKSGLFKYYDKGILDSDSWISLIKPLTTRKYEN